VQVARRNPNSGRESAGAGSGRIQFCEGLGDRLLDSLGSLACVQASECRFELLIVTARSSFPDLSNTIGVHDGELTRCAGSARVFGVRRDEGVRFSRGLSPIP
jgi:hypothetical protein